uniref:Uncharacterized protein n=1 Tax=Rhizophora mucronata TaxID=61149 RepID=A0A2P2PWR0_RHIMU
MQQSRHLDTDFQHHKPYGVLFDIHHKMK